MGQKYEIYPLQASLCCIIWPVCLDGMQQKSCSFHLEESGDHPCQVHPPIVDWNQDAAAACCKSLAFTVHFLSFRMPFS